MIILLKYGNRKDKDVLGERAARKRKKGKCKLIKGDHKRKLDVLIKKILDYT